MQPANPASSAPPTLQPSPLPPLPSLASLLAQHPSRSIHSLLDAHLLSLHSFLTSFTYKSSPGPEHTPAIQSIKSQPMRAISLATQHILHARLPIKCLEATVLALHLTPLPPPHPSYAIRRFPLRFRSTCAGNNYWHILLAIQLTWDGFEPPPGRQLTGRSGAAATWGSRWGVVSLSRHAPLGYRALEYPTLSALCEALRAEYQLIGHQVVGMTVGLPMEEGERSREPLHWHFLAIDLPSALQSIQEGEATTVNEKIKEREAQEEGEGEVEGEELQLGTVPVVDSEAVRAEWKVVRGVLDRYALNASALLRQLRINGRSPSMARPLPPLHPLVHWESRSQQMRYTGGKVRSNSTMGTGRLVVAPRVKADRGRTPPVARARFGV